MVTRGERGALVDSSSGVEAVTRPQREVVDATGAGDSVAGVIAAGLALGVPGRAGAGRGGRDGGRRQVVAVWGATAGLPPADEARASLEAARSARDQRQLSQAPWSTISWSRTSNEAPP